MAKGDRGISPAANAGNAMFGMGNPNMQPQPNRQMQPDNNPSLPRGNDMGLDLNRGIGMGMGSMHPFGQYHNPLQPAPDQNANPFGHQYGYGNMQQYGQNINGGQNLMDIINQLQKNNPNFGSGLIGSNGMHLMNQPNTFRGIM